jgi:metal-responsive CopG/Arc/MetJ family transcriptional regulator
MRLTINLDDDLYAVAKSLAQTRESSISDAVNQLLRQGLERPRGPSRRSKTGLPVVRCDRRFTSDDVAAIDGEIG